MNQGCEIRASDQMSGQKGSGLICRHISRPLKKERKSESVRGNGGERQKSEAPNHVEPQID